MIVTLICWLTPEEVALKLAEVSPVGTVTEAGTCNAALLLARFTVVELVAAAFKDAVQAFD